ncbi:hypothetical protein ABFS82_04G148500 [Erythranthe guttata]|uniref:myb-like protein X n=1 Tax=Erythranthe guttata TaxID=4155 RepID=UPI00064DE9A3|nr:PREDICTED: myb-like protein X [Erythranthe guttata]|eukprot:XP_012853886.1 PREDICTED: myb-like protein X [Erythranthe guttata]
MGCEFRYVNELPVGYRFRPNDDELMEYYLGNKVLDKPVPGKGVKTIDADEFYKDPPHIIVKKYNPLSEIGEREWYFFVRHVKKTANKQQEGKKEEIVDDENKRVLLEQKKENQENNAITVLLEQNEKNQEKEEIVDDENKRVLLEQIKKNQENNATVLLEQNEKNQEKEEIVDNENKRVLLEQNKKDQETKATVLLEGSKKNQENNKATVLLQGSKKNQENKATVSLEGSKTSQENKATFLLDGSKKNQENKATIDEENKNVRRVGDRIGYWKSTGIKEYIINGDNNKVFAFKIHFTFYKGIGKITPWTMDEYHFLKSPNQENQRMDEWVLIKIMRGKDYNKCC